MTQTFHEVFVDQLKAHYGMSLPANGVIARDIVIASDLDYLSHESVRKWRKGLATPSIQYLSAITAWLDRPFAVWGRQIYFINTGK